MKPWFVVLAACSVCLAARSQQAPPAATSTPSATGAPASGGAPATGAPPGPIYRVELVVFRAVSSLGGPENWSAENGSAGSTPSSTGGASAPGASPPGVPAADTSSASASSPGTAAASSSAATPSSAGSPAQSPAASSSSSSSPLATPSEPAGADSAAGGADAQLAEQRAYVRSLPAAAFQLDSVAARLRSSGRYLPVAHAAWSQTASPWGHPVEIPLQSLGFDTQGLSGTVSLQRGQYLHLELSLDYAIDEPPPGLRAAPGTVFSLHEVHRVRFYERNYFDHPAFGVIALVTPLQESRHARR